MPKADENRDHPVSRGAALVLLLGAILTVLWIAWLGLLIYDGLAWALG